MSVNETLSRALDYLPQSQQQDILKALAFAQALHAGQKRRTGEPFVTHPIAVATLLASMKMDTATIMAGLLHDILEDTPTNLTTLKKQFGASVAQLVDGVSKLTRIEFKSRIDQEAENLRKMLLATAKDIRVIIIKLVDRWHNMQSLDVHRPEKRRRIARETLDIYAPIARRLGMHEISTQLEDLGFLALYPWRYHTIEHGINQMRDKRKLSLKQLQKLIEQHLEKYNLPESYQVIAREKHLYSIYQKMRHKKIPLREVYDVYAFRIITGTRTENCYRTLGIIHQLYKPMYALFKDYIALPKPNGYQSLHTVLFGPSGIPVEIQIRTEHMDHIAQHGIASHELYKTKGLRLNHKQLIIHKKWITSLLFMQEKNNNSSTFIENFKIDLFPRDIYVFTPKGDILHLPKESTVIDFAYAIHPHLGNCCMAARVDHNLSPLATVLHSGQTVEVIVAEKNTVNIAWLDLVATVKARHHIESTLAKYKQRKLDVLGKRLLKQALTKNRTSLSDIPQKNIESVLRNTHLKNINALFKQIGLGYYIPDIIAHSLIHPGSITEKSTQKHASSAQPLLIRGAENIAIELASCCHPIPQDSIIGILKEEEGLVVHNAQCPSLNPLHYDKKNYIPVRWEENLTEDFTTILKIELANQLGMLAAITSNLSYQNSNITNIKCIRTQPDHCVVLITIVIKHAKHLADIMATLKRIDGVSCVQRTFSA